MKHRDAIPVSPRDIAELASVEAAAVSNWARRFAEGDGAFPKPLGHGGASPLYDWRTVRRWLAGREQTAHVVAIRDRDVALRGAYNSLRDAEPALLERIVPAVAAAWCGVLRAGGRGSLDAFVAFLAGEGAAHPSWQSLEPVAADALRLLGVETRELVPSWGLARLGEAFAGIPPELFAPEVDKLLERIAASKGRSGESYGYVNSRISAILGALAAARAPRVLYDPTAGIGAVALRVWDLVDRTQRPERIVLHDISPKALEIASERGLLRGAPVSTAQANILTQDPEPGLRADVVVCETPFGVKFDGSPLDPRWSGVVQSKGSADLAWLSHAASHLAPAGRAYVVTGMPALFRAPDDPGRAALLERGLVEAVIGLPAKMLRYTSTATALWVLCGQGESAWPGEVLVIDANDVDPDSVDVVQWLAGRGDVGSRLVAISELGRSGADLNPLRWVTASATAAFGSGVDALRHRAVGREFADARSALEETLAKVGAAAEDLTLRLDAGGVVVQTVAELLDWGIVSVSRRRTTSPDALEVRDREQLSPDYFRLMLNGPWNQHVWASKSDGPSIWTRVQIPLVPVEQQREIVESHRRIEAVEQGLEKAVNGAAALRSAYLDLVRYGSDTASQDD